MIICAALNLTQGESDRLLELHAEAPLSQFQIRQRERWDAANALKKEASSNREASAEALILRDQVKVLEGKLAAVQGGAAGAYLLALTDILECIVHRIELSPITGAPVAPMICDCCPISFEDPRGWCCDICRAFHALGFPDGWVSVEVAYQRLADLVPNTESDRDHVLNTPHIPAVKKPDSSSVTPESR